MERDSCCQWYRSLVAVRRGNGYRWLREPCVYDAASERAEWELDQDEAASAWLDRGLAVEPKWTGSATAEFA